jgi:Transmembrane secretion effector
MSALVQPLRLGAFRRLLGAYAINALGNWAGQIALSIVVLGRTHSAAAVAAVMIAGQFLPALIAPRLVAAAESFGARTALPAMLVAEAGLFVLLAGMAHTGSIDLMLGVVALDGIFALASRALIKAAIVAITSPKGLLREGNALLIGVFTTCMAIGPVLAGVTIDTISPQAALLADAGSFLLAATALLGRVHIMSADRRDDLDNGSLRAALAYVRDQPQLRRLLGGYGLVCLCGAAILPLEVVLVTGTLHASASCFGTVLASWGIGGVLGGAMAARLRHQPLVPLLAAAFVLMGLSYLGMGSATSATTVIAFSFVGGIGNGIEGFASLTAIQERTDTAFQGRVSGLVESLSAATTGLGFLLGGLLSTLGSVRLVYLASGLAILACTAVIANPPRTLQTAAS